MFFSLRKLSLSFLGLVFVLFFPNHFIVWATFLGLFHPQTVDAYQMKEAVLGLRGKWHQKARTKYTLNQSNPCPDKKMDEF